MRAPILFAAATFFLAACATHDLSPATQDSQRKITLSGDLTRRDFQTYRELPFNVPAGTSRIEIELSYDHGNRTVIDLGLRDPNGPRGWSGGNKSRIVIDEMDATPSYRAGPLTPGTWTVVLGVPNIREGMTAHFTAKVTLEKTVTSAFTDTPISSTPGWRRGDFHMHTGHSDGSCEADQNAGAGKRIPCPVIRTLEAAQQAGLDFIFVTDHNTLSQAEALRELQPAFPDLLLLPGEEITTFHGHAGALGVTRPLEFQLGSKRLPRLDNLLDAVEAQGAILSINHPGQPSGEDCMGCGWTVADTDYRRIVSIEAVNGASVRAGKTEGPTSGIAFWQDKLNRGFHITAIGGSDNHDATDRTGKRQTPVGMPATVVWADDLSMQGVLNGVRSGRAFIDLAPDPAHRFDAEAHAGSSAAHMGETLRLAAGDEGEFTATAAGADGARIEIVSGGLTVTGNRFRLADGAQKGWIRANVRDATGKLIMLGNPVYIAAK